MKWGINPLKKNFTDLMSESYACGYMSEEVSSSAQEANPFRGVFQNCNRSVTNGRREEKTAEKYF